MTSTPAPPVDAAPPTWTILIPTIGQRAELFTRLLDVLLPQLDQHGGAVRVLAYWNNGERGLPSIRQALVAAASSEYMSFVDDDDLVPDYYVDETMRALSSGPDYVGWQVQYCVDGIPQGIAYHSLRHDGWFENKTGLYRDVSHINPVRTALARQADFRRTRPGRAEDRVWVSQMRGRLKTEVVVDKVMYLYLWSPSVSVWRHPEHIDRGPFVRPEVRSPWFAWHPDSVGG